MVHHNDDANNAHKYFHPSRSSDPFNLEYPTTMNFFTRCWTTSMSSSSSAAVIESNWMILCPVIRIAWFKVSGFRVSVIEASSKGISTTNTSTTTKSCAYDPYGAYGSYKMCDTYCAMLDARWIYNKTHSTYHIIPWKHKYIYVIYKHTYT